MKDRRSQRPTIEIERKFLVEQVPFRLDGYPATDIEQGYLEGTSDALHVRIRRGQERYTLTIKHGSGITRTEIELELDTEQADALWPLTTGQRLEKTRYTVPLGVHEADLDVFRGRLAGLILCEVEFATSEEAEGFCPPEWFAQEVTFDVRYGNYSLARSLAVPDLKL